MNKYTYLGTSDEVTTCDCCGKSELKSTVAISDDDAGETVYFGSTCAAKALKVQLADVKRGTAAADRAKQEARREAAAVAHRAEMVRWRAYLVEQTGGIRDFAGEFCIGMMIQKLGGFAAARAGYREV